MVNLDLIEHYQLMKELLPAEWLPINMTVIFFLGASRVTLASCDINTSFKNNCSLT
jgi:hypothetical protein